MNLIRSKFQVIAASIFITLLGQNVVAQNADKTASKGYNFEVNADYSFSDTKYKSNIFSDSKTNYVIGGLTYYFGTVDISEGPLALATFYDRSSAIHASFGPGKFDSDGQEFDFNTLNAAGSYVHKSSGWLAYGNYSRTEVDVTPEDITNIYAITVGKYFAENSILTIGYENSDASYRGASTYTISNFHAEALGNDSYFDGGIAISYIDFEDSEDAFEFNFETTYYFTRAIGLGVVAAYTTGEELSSFRYGLNAEWFVANNFSINAVYNRVNNENEGFVPDFDNNFVSAGLKLRF